MISEWLEDYYYYYYYYYYYSVSIHINGIESTLSVSKWKASEER